MSKRAGQTGALILRHDRWVGRFYVDTPEGRTRKAVVLGLRSELSKTEAKLKLLNLITGEGVNTPQHLERLLKPVTVFADVASAWELKRLPHLKESSQYATPKLLAKHIRPYFDAMPIDQIRTGIVNDWLDTVSQKGLEPKTVHNLYKLFRAIVNWHAQQNDEQPRKFYPNLPVVSQAEQRWFTPEESRRIIEAASGQYKTLFRLAAFSGLRFGELAGLHVEDVDFARGVIRVRRSVWRGQEVSPKTAKGYRDVWIDSATVAVIRSHLGTRTAGRVFQSRVGTPLTNRDVCRRVLRPICEKLNIPFGGMHAFRHGRVSHLQASGVPADFTKSQVGHSSLRTTALYTHFTPEFSREIAERLAS